MSATEKNANSFSMTSLSAVNSGYSLMLINNSTNEGQLITMTDLATMILNELRNQTFTATELGQAAASTLPAAISSLNSAMIRYTPVNAIVANTNLNDFTEPGTYYSQISSASDYATIANCPVSIAFRLDVIDIKPRSSNGRYNYAYQDVVAFTAPWQVYRRYVVTRANADTWSYSAWHLFEGTTVSV